MKLVFLLPLSFVLVACSGDEPGPVDPAAPIATSIELVSGDGQSGRVDEPLPEPIVVRVLDQYGEPFPGQTVDFLVTAGGGEFVVDSATSDATGLAQGVWRLGTSATAPQSAYARLISYPTGEYAAVTFDATARAGEVALLLFAGTEARVERGDTIVIEFSGYDAFGNPVPADSFDVDWQVSDSSVASIEDGRVVGLAEGDVEVSARSGELDAAMPVHVEGTRSTRFPLRGSLVAGDGRLLLVMEGSIREWDGSAWVATPMIEPTMFTSDMRFAPVTSELWALYGGTVFRSATGTSWTASIELDIALGQSPALGFMPDGAPVVVADAPDTTRLSLIEPRVMRLEGGSWVDLEMPAVVAGDTLVLQSYDVAVAPNGDVYVGGFAGTSAAASSLLGRPFVARFDGATWTFLDVGTTAAWIAELETTSDGVVARRQPVNNLYGWSLLHIDGDVVETTDNHQLLGPGAFRFVALAVSEDGDIAFTYYDTNHAQAGVAFETADGWETWQDPHIQTSPGPSPPGWHEGDVWFPMSEGFQTEQWFVVRLEPQE